MRQAIPAPRSDLAFDNAWQLLVATILAAQSTDRTVNRVTRELFLRFARPAELGLATQDEVEAIVRPTGFFRNKARAIREASQMIAASFGGDVPRDMAALLRLPGVARKTANVVLQTAYQIPSGFVVDTHVTRVARRLGLTTSDDPTVIEDDLCEVWPREHWIEDGQRLVLHGRYVCTARAPKCETCPLNELCPSQEAPPVEPWERRAAMETEAVGAAPP